MKPLKPILPLYALLVLGLPLAGLGYALLGSVVVVGPLAEGFTGRYWRALGHEPGLGYAALYSLWIAVASVGLSVVLALGLVLRAQPTLRRAPLPGLLYVPLVLPALVVAFYLFQLLSRTGWLSRISFQLGLTSSLEAFPELVQDGAGLGIILAHVLLIFPFLTLLFQAIYQESRLAELDQLTSTLGASAGQFRRRVAAPLLLRRAAPTVLLSFIATLGAYDIPLLLGRPYPQMLSVFIATKLQRFDLRELPAAYLAGFLVASGLLVLILVLLRLVNRSRVETG
ncbi:ABC transporter permease subunit [Hymenobacter actinosclerus]|uniref:Putative spermidine/putrescine transport system permease protein n=1 Tax=Hymenobacter actinosclerus TaxID=82805 RepID=A0A1I0ERM1_9BACT|nr:ABC transporter permease subunit [Hymenobacter actinosclerus]SET48002.1 putative spermidine/putrescine transport system permease protein [Hymenobacter actinosclerus]